MNSLVLKSLIIPTLVLVMTSCGATKEPEERLKTEDLQLRNGRQIVDAPIVEVSMVLKNAKISSHSDYYVRRNIQDYFIKFCDNDGISKKELEQAMTMKDGISQVLRLEVEFRDGLWDSCDPEEIVQSRTGEYIVIHKILD